MKAKAKADADSTQLYDPEASDQKEEEKEEDKKEDKEEEKEEVQVRPLECGHVNEESSALVIVEETLEKKKKVLVPGTSKWGRLLGGDDSQAPKIEEEYNRDERMRSIEQRLGRLLKVAS